MVRVIALIDGEHHPGVSRDALDRLASDHDLCAVLFVGGEEKVPAAALADPVVHFGRDVSRRPGPPWDALRELAPGAGANAVVDLSGEPILDGEARFRLASVALDLGLEYRSPGFRLSAPASERLPFDGPVIGVIGTGKRTGKTALAGHYAELLRERAEEPVIVSMGRGGPREPQLVRSDQRPDLAALLELARSGRHAASDYLEDAVLTGVSCVGCRRCGEGPAGETFESNVVEGAKLALTLEPDVILIEGSGATLPPIEADRTICVTSADSAGREALGYLGPYRLLKSQLVVVVGADRLSAGDLRDLKRSLAEWSGEAAIAGCRFEPEPLDPLPPGARVAAFTTVPARHEDEMRDHLSGQGIDVRIFSSALGRRAELERDLEQAVKEGCDLFLTELKAAAIELVADRADREGIGLVFLRNRPVSLPGEPDLDAELTRLYEELCLPAGEPR